jgi:2-oxoisovalerate dehydrogenase E1 component
MAEAVAVELRQEELRVEIVVPSLLSPFPRATLSRVLRGRERIVMIEETHAGCGFSAELGAVLLEAGFRGSYARVAMAPVPIPAARSLESLVMPDRRSIFEAVLQVLNA